MTVKRKKGAPRLTSQQMLFVEAYVATLNGAEAARRAGYTAKSPQNTAWVLLKNPKIQEAVDKRLAEAVASLRLSRDHVILRLFELASANLADYVEVSGGAIKLRDDIPPEKLTLIKTLHETENGIRVELFDKPAILDKIARHYGLYDKTRQAIRRPDSTTLEILERLEKKEISPMEAAIACDCAGVPIPESLRLMLARMEPEPQTDDNGEYAVISHEAMAERAKVKEEEIARQAEIFVKERTEEVNALKEELGGGSFQAPTDTKKE